MRILVTGANGYLGRGIVKYLLDQKNEVIATDYDTEEIDTRAIRKPCDLFSIEDPYNYFGKPEVILHLAWKDGFKHYSDSHIRELPNHVEFIKKITQSEVEKISIMGSMHEVGFFEGSIDENTPCNPLSYYGIAKNALRQIAKIYCVNSEKHFQWLRGYYIVGNTETGSSIFSKIVCAEKQNQKKFPFTTGMNQFDFLNYEEFCRRVVATVCQSEIEGIINICSGRPEKIGDRVERFIADNGFKIELDYGKFEERPYDSKAVWGNSEKIEKILKRYESV